MICIVLIAQKAFSPPSEEKPFAVSSLCVNKNSSLARSGTVPLHCCCRLLKSLSINLLYVENWSEGYAIAFRLVGGKMAFRDWKARQIMRMRSDLKYSSELLNCNDASDFECNQFEYILNATMESFTYVSIRL